MSLNVDFRECPDCGSYGVKDNGDNCRRCGGSGRGGLRGNGGGTGQIGSGEIMIDKTTRQEIDHKEFLRRVRAREAQRNQGALEL